MIPILGFLKYICKYRVNGLHCATPKLAFSDCFPFDVGLFVVVFDWKGHLNLLLRIETNRITISWDLVKNAESEAPHEICRIRTDEFLTRTLDDLYAHENLKSPYLENKCLPVLFFRCSWKKVTVSTS